MHVDAGLFHVYMFHKTPSLTVTWTRGLLIVIIHICANIYDRDLFAVYSIHDVHTGVIN